MGLKNCFNKNDDRFARMSKEKDYKKFLEVVEKYKGIEPKVYDRMVKDFEKNLRKIHYLLSPYSNPTAFDKDYYRKDYYRINKAFEAENHNK